MSSLKIATWNINSVRIRLPLLKALHDEASPDIICLQEIKVIDALFPFEEVAALGYEHAYVHGQKGYNGVAILSKIPLEVTEKLDFVDCDQFGGGARHIAAKLPDGTELHNVYIPAGGDIPDRQANPYYGYKLDYVDAMRAWFSANRNASDKLVMVGDFNIAPLEHDVWSHKQLLKVVSHTPQEVQRLEALTDFGWQDAARHFTPAQEKLYSWWSYRNKDWTKSNRGRRLDHIWLTQPLLGSLSACESLNHFRSAEKPSDHVPIVITLS